MIVPVHVAEIRQQPTAGRIVTQNELMIVTGQFLAFKNAAAKQPVSL